MKNNITYIVLIGCLLIACDKTNMLSEEENRHPADLFEIVIGASSTGYGRNTKVSYDETRFSWDEKDEIGVTIGTTIAQNNNNQFIVTNVADKNALLIGEIVPWKEPEDRMVYARFPYSHTNVITTSGSTVFDVAKKQQLMIFDKVELAQRDVNSHGYLLAQSAARVDVAANRYTVDNLAFEQVLTFLKLKIQMPNDEKLFEIGMIATDEIFTTQSEVTISNGNVVSYRELSKTDTLIAEILKDDVLAPSEGTKKRIYGYVSPQIAMFPLENLDIKNFTFYIKTTYKKANLTGSTGRKRDYIMYEMNSDQLNPAIKKLERNHIYELTINLTEATHYPDQTSDLTKRKITKFPVLNFMSTHHLKDEITNLPSPSFAATNENGIPVYAGVKKIVLNGNALDQNDFSIFHNIQPDNSIARTLLEDIESIDIAQTTTTAIYYRQFYKDQSIKEIILPKSLHSFTYNRETNESLAFAESGLESIILPENFKEFGGAAFYNCKKLKSVTILNPEPPEVSLTNMNMGGAVNETFDGCDCLEAIYVPKESLDKYKKKYAKYSVKIKPLTVSK